MHLVSTLQVVAFVAVLQSFCGAVRAYVPSCGPSRIVVQNQPQAPTLPEQNPTQSVEKSTGQNPQRMTEDRNGQPVDESVDLNPPQMTEDRNGQPVDETVDLNPPQMTEDRSGQPVDETVDLNPPQMTEDRSGQPVDETVDLNPPQMTEDRKGKQPVVEFVVHYLPRVPEVGIKRANQSQQIQSVPEGSVNHLGMDGHTTIPSLINSVTSTSEGNKV